MSRTSLDTALFTNGTVERDTGIGCDTLRIWERRYGFPTPERNEKGERVYSAEQIRRLQRIRRVLDQIVTAVERSGVSTVALSFSACYSRGSIRVDLEELADRLPRDVGIWIGGEGVTRLRRLPPVVERKSLESI